MKKKETRKVCVHRGEVLSKIKEVVPEVSVICYEDKDGDEITANTEDEMTAAVFDENISIANALIMEEPTQQESLLRTLKRKVQVYEEQDTAGAACSSPKKLGDE